MLEGVVGDADEADAEGDGRVPAAVDDAIEGGIVERAEVVDGAGLDGIEIPGQGIRI